MSTLPILWFYLYFTTVSFSIHCDTNISSWNDMKRLYFQLSIIAPSIWTTRTIAVLLFAHKSVIYVARILFFVSSNLFSFASSYKTMIHAFFTEIFMHYIYSFLYTSPHKYILPLIYQEDTIQLVPRPNISVIAIGNQTILSLSLEDD